MLFSPLFINIVLAVAAIAAPGSLIEARHAQRAVSFAERAAKHKSLPLQHVSDHVSATNTSNDVFSSNWAGASWEGFALGAFVKVTGTFTVPTPSAPNGQASIWVGIDGDTCQTAILQTGVDISYNNGAISYDAWYEWYPAFAVFFNGISFSPGNTVRLTVMATTTTSGSAKIENLSTGVTVSKSLTSSSPLCMQDAEWIIEDFSQGGSLVPLCNFGTITFTNAVATEANGTTVGPSGATVIEMEQNGVVLTSVTEGPGNSVTIKYTGP